MPLSEEILLRITGVDNSRAAIDSFRQQVLLARGEVSGFGAALQRAGRAFDVAPALASFKAIQDAARASTLVVAAQVDAQIAHLRRLGGAGVGGGAARPPAGVYTAGGGFVPVAPAASGTMSDAERAQRAYIAALDARTAELQLQEGLARPAARSVAGAGIRGAVQADYSARTFDALEKNNAALLANAEQAGRNARATETLLQAAIVGTPGASASVPGLSSAALTAARADVLARANMANAIKAELPGTGDAQAKQIVSSLIAELDGADRATASFAATQKAAQDAAAAAAASFARAQATLDEAERQATLGQADVRRLRQAPPVLNGAQQAAYVDAMSREAGIQAIMQDRGVGRSVASQIYGAGLPAEAGGLSTHEFQTAARLGVSGIGEQFGIPRGFGYGAALLGPAAILGLGTGALALYSGKKASEYDQAVRDTLSQSGFGTNGPNFDTAYQQLSQGIQAYVASGKSPYRADVLAQSVEPLLAHGFGVGAVLQALPSIADVSYQNKAPDLTTVANFVNTLAATRGAGKATSGAQLTDYANFLSRMETMTSIPPGQISRAMPNLLAASYGTGVGVDDLGALMLKVGTAQPSARLDATSLFRLVTELATKNTAGAHKEATALGLQMGPGAVQSYGGIFPMLQAYQQATAGPEQGALLAKLFPQANALKTFEYIFGGGGLTQAAGYLPGLTNRSDAAQRTYAQMAQGTQLRSTELANKFNSDLITLGTTMNKTVVPALLAMADAALISAGSVLKDASKQGGLWKDMNSLFGNTTSLPKPFQAAGNLVDQLLNALGLESLPKGTAPTAAQAAQAARQQAGQLRVMTRDGRQLTLTEAQIQGGAYALPPSIAAPAAAAPRPGTAAETDFAIPSIQEVQRRNAAATARALAAVSTTFDPRRITAASPFGLAPNDTYAAPPLIQPVRGGGTPAAALASVGDLAAAHGGLLAAEHAQALQARDDARNALAAQATGDQTGLATLLAKGAQDGRIQAALATYISAVTAEVAGGALDSTKAGKQIATARREVGSYEYAGARGQFDEALAKYKAGTGSLAAVQAAEALAKGYLPDLGKSQGQQGYLAYAMQSQVDKAANDKRVQAAQLALSGAQIDAESARIHKGSVAQQMQAAQDVYAKQLALVNLEASLHQLKGKDLQSARDQAADVRDRSLAALAQTGLSQVQERATLAQLQNSPAGLQAAVAATATYLTAHRGQLFGADQTAYQIALLQNQQQTATLQRLNPAMSLIRPQSNSLRLQEAGYGASTAMLALGAGGGKAETVALLQEALRKDDAEIVELRQMVAYLRRLDQTNQVTAANTRPRAAPNRQRDNRHAATYHRR